MDTFDEAIKPSPYLTSQDQRDGQEEEDYQQQSVSEIKQKFSKPAHSPSTHHRTSSHRAGVIEMHPQPGMPSYVPKRPTMWKKPTSAPVGLADPGWTPGTPKQHQPAQRLYSSPQARSPPVNRPHQRSPQQMPNPAPPREHHYEPPAWLGSLRHSGGPRQWELEEGEQLMGGGARTGMRRQSPQTAHQYAPAASGGGPGGEPPVAVHQPRLQTMHYGSGGGGTYGQSNAAGQDSDTARVAHLQYNTPMGLYSRQNAEEALMAQTQGRAGEGTMQITGDGKGARKTFDPVHSDVYRMVAEEDGRRGRNEPAHQHPPARSSHRQPQHQQQRGHHGDHHHGNQQQGVGVESQFSEMGISDF